ncbi:MAG: PTS sugar transporter subunit IIA [Proteobacteria bacterium]|nr:PTS sugar transporter subunit IIA [Pseudomonadota bacterium]
MALGDLLTRNQIIADMQAGNRWEAIDELLGNLVAVGALRAEHREATAAAVRKRESTMSTGIGFGIALPHASTEFTSTVVGVLGRSRKRISFESLDGQPVSLVLLLLVPQGQFQQHLHTVASVARMLHKEAFRRMLEQAADADAMLHIIRNQPPIRA